MEQNRKRETEEERRERVRRLRARKEVQKQRMRKKKLIRLAVYMLIVVLGILMIVAVIAIVNKVREDRAEKTVEEAIREEITNSEFYDSAHVLHLSFPVLTLDGAGSGLSVSEFRMILDDLYARGYVLIDPYSLAARSEKGFAAAEIMVPSGKQPMILSQYDASYEAGDTAHATALTKDASGRISCTYYDEYGTLSTGAVDVVPIVEEFIEAHPDFSHKGARGILGVTGYRGVLGYAVEVDETDTVTIPIDRPNEEDDWYTDDSIEYGEDAAGFTYIKENKRTYALLAEDLARYAASEPEGNSEEMDSDDATDAGEAEESEETADPGTREEEEAANINRETVKGVISTLRSGGWHIASNTFNEISYAGSAELVQADAERWNTVVAPLIGSTDLLMLPQSADIGKWSGYTDGDARYTMLRELGFRYYFVNNDETKTWAQIRPAYVRQGLHEITEYASYLALVNENGSAAAVGREPEEQLMTNGTRELVGTALQSEEPVE